MTVRAQVSEESNEDPNADAPEGAEGDGNRVTIRDDSSSGNQPSTDEGGDERPEWLPEKFESVEAMAEAYAELERKMSSGGSDDEDEGGEDTTLEDVQEAGFDPEKLAQELQENDGALTDETMEALEKAGFSEEVVNAYIEGQKALADQRASRVYEMAGGQEEYQTMIEWARNNFSEEEAAAYDLAMDSGNEASIRFAVKGLKSAYVEANGDDPSLTRADSRSSDAGPRPFASNDEMVKAIANPEYRTNPAYRAKVKARIAAS